MTSEKWHKDYRVEVQLSSLDTTSNNSFAKTLNLIGENKRVLEFGCATGYFSQMLSEKGCNVVGVEINSIAAQKAEKYCSKVMVADLDSIPLDKILLNDTFDVAVFGDVLEHLRDPWHVLESVKNYLKPGGFIVASIPNIAHGAVRLSLLQGNFNYQRYGILDDTHIRFFTKSTIIEMIEKSGYFLDVLDRTKVPVLADSNLLPHFNRSEISPEIINKLELDEESSTLQFIIRAYPESEQNRYTALMNKYQESTEKNNTLMENLKELSHAAAENQAIKGSMWWRMRKIFRK